jgi:hypothetical protein
MAATFDLIMVNGAASGSPATGTGTTTVTAGNWKNIDDATTAYSASPITAGSNSFSQYLALHFSGTYNQISAGLWAHTATSLGANIILKGKVAPNSNTYSSPSTTTDTDLTVDMSSAISIGSGQAVQFGATSPQAAGKAASTTSNPAWSEWLATQLQPASNASPGDTGNATFTAQYSEN